MECAFCYKVKFMETSVYTNHNLEKTIRRLVTNCCQSFNRGNGYKGERTLSTDDCIDPLSCLPFLRAGGEKI